MVWRGMAKKEELVLQLYRVRNFLRVCTAYEGSRRVDIQEYMDNLDRVIAALEDLKEWPS